MLLMNWREAASSRLIPFSGSVFSSEEHRDLRRMQLSMHAIHTRSN